MFLEYAGLLLASAAFEFAYVAWARSAARGAVLGTVFFSVLTAGLGLAGVGGALRLPYGWGPYLAGIALGAFVSAHLGRKCTAEGRTQGPGG